MKEQYCNYWFFVCIRANSTRRFSFRWVGMGKLWLYTALSSFGVSFTSKSVFIPISSYYLAKTSWRSTRIVSIACFSISVTSVLVQSNRSRSFVWDSVSFFGFNCYFPFNSSSFLRICVCLDVWSSILLGFCSVGNQNVLLCCSVLFALTNSFK